MLHALTYARVSLKFCVVVVCVQAWRLLAHCGGGELHEVLAAAGLGDGHHHRFLSASKLHLEGIRGTINVRAVNTDGQG